MASTAPSKSLMTDMTRSELERLGSLIWGARAWKGVAAQALGVDRKTVSRWIRDDFVPPWAATQLRAMAHIAPPPGSTSDQDRDDACVAAIEGDLSKIVELAESAGWHRAEVSAAILSLAVSDIQSHAGQDATLDVLDQVRAAVAES